MKVLVFPALLAIAIFVSPPKPFAPVPVEPQVVSVQSPSATPATALQVAPQSEGTTATLQAEELTARR